MAVRVTSERIDISAEVRALTGGRSDIGALVTFTGYVRDMTDGAVVTRLTLEHYPGMTEKALSGIEAEARERWALSATRIVHRFGVMEPGEEIVLVAAASAHRQAAFEAASFMMDYLKTRAPFWKKEEGAASSGWVEAREVDEKAARRWE